MQQVRSEVKTMIDSRDNTVNTPRESPAFPSSKESFNPPLDVDLGEPSHIPQGGQTCTLYLAVTYRRIVADALIYTDHTTHHNIEIPSDLRRVAVKCVREGEDKTTIPIEDDEVPDLGRAIGSFILWLNHLIQIAAATTPIVRNTLLELAFHW